MDWKLGTVKDHTVECWNCEGAGESGNESCRECFGTGEREVGAESYAPDTWKEAEGLA